MSEHTFTLNPGATALVLIDLQRGIAGRQTAPHSASEVIAKSVQLAERFRALGAPVVLVRVSFAPDSRDRLTHPVDAPMQFGTPPPGWDEIVPEFGPREGDLLVTKQQWGAFYGTALDLQLRRRGIDTIVLGGIATNMGVESTARDAYEHNYGLVLVEDGMASMSADWHEFAIANIFPRIGRVRSTAQVLAALPAVK